LFLFAGASKAIGLFYGAGFFYGAGTHLTMMEYWRWWVVQLWVEGFFEVIAFNDDEGKAYVLDDADAAEDSVDEPIASCPAACISKE
jgi:hypothetical protein